MKPNRAYFLVILLLSAPLCSQTLDTITMELENNYRGDISAFSNSIASQPVSSNPKYANYGGELGNKYFQFYTRKIIIPSLSKYFISLRTLNEQNDKTKLFNELIDTLGKFRQKVAIATRSKDSISFGKRTNVLNDVISSDTHDPSWISWYKHLQRYFGLDTLNLSVNFKLSDVLANIEQFIRDKKNPALITKHETTSLNINNTNDLSTGAYNIEPNVKGEVTADINIFSKNNLQFTFFHAVALYDNLSKLFFEALDPNLGQDMLLEKIGRFFYYWTQAAIFAEGQASIGEWIMHALAESAGYKLAFSDLWKGRENGSMAPNMYASSYLEERGFLDQFMVNATLTKSASGS